MRRERARCVSLEKENKKMLKELSAFDMEFFDEIEELKSEYSKAKTREKELRHTIEVLRRKCGE